jgi:hypothetical protein
MGTRGHNAPYSHVLVLSPTAPKTSGGSLELVDGQIALTKEKSGTAKGQLVVPNLSGASKKDEFKIQVGTGRKSEAGNITNKNFATVPFTKDEVLDVTYSAALAPTYASVTLGYNGVAGTGFALKEKQATTVSLSLTGDALGYLGYSGARADLQFSIFAGNPDDCTNCAEPCSSVSCKDITSNLVERIRNHELRAGSSSGTGASVKVSDIIDVIPTFSCAPVKTPTATATYYTLTINDGGTQEDLAVVAQSYPTQVVNRLSREGIVSVYEILTTGSSPAAFSPLASNKLLLDCDCPVNYTAAVGGWVYSIEVDDAGADISTTLLDGIAGISDQDGAVSTTSYTTSAAGVTAGTYTGKTGTASASGTGATFTIVVGGGGTVTSVTLTGEGSGYVVGETITILGTAMTGGTTTADDIVVTVVSLENFATSVTKANNNYNIGTYVVAFESELTSANIAAIEAVNDTYTVTFEGQAETLCVPNSQPADTSWVAGDTCTVSTQQYYIDLKDSVCGDSRLAELQDNYPNLTITEDTTTEHSNCRRRYLTTVTSNVVCEGCETPEYIFEAPIDFSFESWKAVAIEEGGLTSFTTAPDSTFDIANNASIAVATGSITTSGTGTGASFTVNANADGTFKSITLTTSGSGYEVGETITIPGTALSGNTDDDIVLTITGVSGVFPTDCECGITFKAKEGYLCPPAMLANNGADYNSIMVGTPQGVKIQVSAGEAPTRLLEGYKFVTTPFKVTYDVRHFEGTGWGKSFMKAESEQYQRFLGVSHPKNYAEGYLMGFETKLEPCAQYDTVTVKIHRSRYSGTQSRTVDEDIRYIFVFDSGRLCEYKDFFNALGGDFTCPA